MGFLTETGKAHEPMLISSQALEDLLLVDFMKDLFAGHTGGQAFSWERYLTRRGEDIQAGCAERIGSLSFSGGKNDGAVWLYSHDQPAEGYSYGRGIWPRSIS